MWTKYSDYSNALAVCAVLAFHCTIAPEARADAKFFPPETKFKSEDKIDFGDLLFKGTKFKDFRATAFESGKGSATETYDTRFQALVSKKGGGFKPVFLTGPFVKSFKETNEKGTWETEIISMDLSGKSPQGSKLKLTVSSSPASTGLAMVTPGKEPVLGDSFFDIFFELTVDNGDPIPPASRPSRYTLVPEPASLGLLLAGLLGFSAYRRQEQRRKRGDR